MKADSSVSRAPPSLGAQLLTAGTAACIADIITFPLDTAKVRLQVAGEGGSGWRGQGVLSTVGQVARREGVTALYRGLVPGLQRQMAFSAIRIGLYENFKSFYKNLFGLSAEAEKLDQVRLMGVRVLAGVTTAALAVSLAQPTDVVKVRLQAGARSSQYRGVVHAYTSIARQEGVMGGLWRGTGANITRNAIVNVGETVVYDAAKDALLTSGYMRDGVPCHLVSAAIAGVTATVVASPVDVVKTRYMNAENGVYKGALDCAKQTVVREGVSALYRGFAASCSRLVSWNIVLWLSYEQIKMATSTKCN